MRNNFGSAADNDAVKTTARELANELAASANQMKQSATALRAEIANIDKAKAEIEEERDSMIRTFVKTTVSELGSEQLDTLSALAQQTAAVGGQSLSFQRQRMIESRDKALEEANANLDTTVDAETFHTVLSEAKQKLAKESGEHAAANRTLQNAKTALSTWYNSAEYALEALSDEAAKNGQPALNANNRAHYEPSNIFTAAARHFQNGEYYQKIRDALVERKHLINGKDVIADMAFTRAKTAELKKAVEDAEAVLTAEAADKAKATAVVQQFSGVENRIVTDAQMLEALQSKVVQYLAVPEFAKAVADHYAEDFPKDTALMTAKLTVLSKLEDGAQEKLQAIDANVLALTKTATQVNRLKPYAEVKVDLEQVRRQNAARRAEYENYTTATRDSWSRARTYHRDRDVVVVDNSPSLLEWYLIMHMLDDHRNHGQMCSTSSYTTDMLKLDREQAKSAGIPDAAFEVSPEIARQMKDLGITEYDKTGAFSFTIDGATNDNVQQGNFSFDLDTQVDTAVARVQQAERASYTPPPSTSNYTSEPIRSTGDGGFSFEVREEPARETTRSWEPSTPSSGGFGRSS